jgi:hypothetical protein
MGFLCRIPAAVLLVLVVALAVTLFGGSQLYLNRRFGHHLYKSTTVGGIIICVAGTIYGTILGFMTVAAWQHYQEARDVVVAEADADIDAWHTAVGLPPAPRRRVRADMIQYAHLMVGHEWATMKQGSFDATPAFVGMDAIDAASTFVPANAGESNAQNATMQQLTLIHDSRQRRVAINDGGISWFQWLVLIEGAVWIAALAWALGMRHTRIHLLMSSTIVMLLASMLVLLFELQYPFRSDIGIRPTVWSHAIEHIQQMQRGEPPVTQPPGDSKAPIDMN